MPCRHFAADTWEKFIPTLIKMKETVVSSHYVEKVSSILKKLEIEVDKEPCVCLHHKETLDRDLSEVLNVLRKQNSKILQFSSPLGLYT